MSEQLQEHAIWNWRDPFGDESGRICAYCRDSLHGIELTTLSTCEDPGAANRLVLSGGEWFHDFCLSGMAVLEMQERKPKPQWEPEPKQVSTWLYGTVLAGSILGLPLLAFGAFGFVWNLPVLSIIAGFGFVAALAWADGLD